MGSDRVKWGPLPSGFRCLVSGLFCRVVEGYIKGCLGLKSWKLPTPKVVSPDLAKQDLRVVQNDRFVSSTSPSGFCLAAPPLL